VGVDPEPAAAPTAARGSARSPVLADALAAGLTRPVARRRPRILRALQAAGERMWPRMAKHDWAGRDVELRRIDGWRKIAAVLSRQVAA